MKDTHREFQEHLDRETEARLSRMEQPDYPFPRRFSRRDYLLWGLVTAGCLLLLLAGARL